ncbi:uncharacterized protein LOC133806004 [Humulus lupulus]|uniref:uncharacterized protein LOC133806004 n=1 Tax=Humulus lupulus TaxID=3486 RepID=UPI002B407D24|nr:uncharacterized protein LOC133806004 [Humulus lupulus]
MYGNPVAAERCHTWELLCRIADSIQGPWILGGDFNEILSTEEKSGGNTRSGEAMSRFQRALDYCALDDITRREKVFSWCNGQKTNFIMEKLDRFLANVEWKDRFKDFKIQYLDWMGSDHKANVTVFGEVWSLRETKGNFRSRFHFEEAWCEEATCKQIIEDKWNNGEVCNSPSEFNMKIEECKKKLRSTNPSDEIIDTALRGIQQKISEAMNENLLGRFSEEEVFSAIKGMNPIKAPGIDGLPALFFQKFWNSVRGDVVSVCLKVLNENFPLQQLNETLITLIPKVPKAKMIEEYRPISLCKVVYKIISKCLVERMKSYLAVAVSNSQSVFVTGRMIHDNAIIGYEGLHCMRKDRFGNGKKMALKLDMSKAYDRIEWRFVERLMLKMGYHEEWVKKIMGCITSASFSFLINGEVRGNVTPEHGLCQGDPLSPFIFVLCAEALSSLILEAEQSNLLEGIYFRRRGVKVSHLFFADDKIMFRNADGNGCRALRNILCWYTAASGQVINFSKSEVCFGSKVDEDTKKEIAGMFEVKITEHFEKNLGIPGLVGRSKRETFKSIKGRIWNKIKGWKRSMFSTAGKEVLIKAVVQAMPNYAMKCFRLPLNLINNIHSIAAKFWWGSSEKKRRIHWCKWEELCKRKFRGGLGFKDMELFNKAMLAKQCWRLERFPESLVAKVLKFSYHSNCDFLQAKKGSAPSFIWRSLLWGRKIIEAGSRWRIGLGEEVRIVEDKWLPRPLNFTFLEKPELPAGIRVIDLRKADGEWDEIFIRNIFTKEDADSILSIIPGPLDSRDKRIWHYNQNGEYSVRSGYQVAIREKERVEGSNMRETESWWKKVWSLRVPPKIKLFLWKLSNKWLPTNSVLFCRKLRKEQGCCMCGDSNQREDWYHAIWQCPRNKQVWKVAGFSKITKRRNLEDPISFLSRISLQLPKDKFGFFSTLAWQCWNSRNNDAFRKWNPEATAMVDWAASYLEEFAQTDDAAPAKTNSAHQRWIAPIEGECMINVDAAVNKIQGCCRNGVVIRDRLGDVIASSCTFINCAYDPLVAELLAIQQGINLSKRFNIKGWLIVSDCSLAVGMLNRPPEESGDLDLLVFDIRREAENQSIRSVWFGPRSSNGVAHMIAKFALLS